MVIKHNLQLLMAKHQIRSIKELTRQMESKYGYDYATLYNFNVYVHKKLDPKLVADLCEFFSCDIGELIYLDARKEEKKVLFF